MVIHSELLSDPVGFMGTLLGNSMSIEHDSVMSISLYYLAPLTVIISIMVFVWFSLPSISDLRTRSYCRCTAASTEFNSRVIPLLEKIPYNVPFWYNKHLGATIPFGYLTGKFMAMTVDQSLRLIGTPLDQILTQRRFVFLCLV